MLTVLIIDDDPQNREIVRIRLEKAGHRVLEAENGPDGLEAARHERPDVLILDVMMPQMDGWKVCRALRADEAIRETPVLMLTALGRQIEELRGWESGADEYLTKPCDPACLLEAVERLARSRPAGAKP